MLRLLHLRLQTLFHGVHEFARGHPSVSVLATAGQGEVFRHDAFFIDDLGARGLQLLRKRDQFRGLVELAAAGEAAGPREDRGNRVRRRLAALLVLAVVARDGAVGGFGLKRGTVGGGQDGGHEAERAKALGDDVRLDVAVVVYQCD